MGKVEEISSQLHYHECMFLGCYSLEDISPILSEHIGTCVMCLFHSETSQEMDTDVGHHHNHLHSTL